MGSPYIPLQNPASYNASRSQTNNPPPSPHGRAGSQGRKTYPAVFVIFIVCLSVTRDQQNTHLTSPPLPGLEFSRVF